MISGSASAMTVRARQKLKTAAAADKFNEELASQIQAYIDKGTTPSFDDFDISQNPIPFEQFEAMFTIIQSTGVRVQRMRMFGCSTLDDSVMVVIADWLRNVTPETAPHEMHISDCAMTVEGFTALMDAIESNDAFPTPDRAGKSPIYMRLENNYIQPESAIQEKVNEGVIAEYQKNSGPLRAPVPSAPDAKVKILAMTRGNFKQRQGTPPDPKDAPPPKQVFDRYAEEQMQQKGKGGGKDKGKGYQQPSSYGYPPAQAAWQALPAPGWGGCGYGGKGMPAWQPQQQQQAAWGPKGGHSAKGSPAPAAQQPGARFAAQASVRPQPTFNAFNAFAGGQNGKGAAGGGKIAQNMQRGADRSRTPAPRSAPPPPKPKGNGLPAGWEEHFSDEYQIPYYWNVSTGESLWEKPTA